MHVAASREQTYEAIILRTIRYGESDLIIHVLSAEHGHGSCIAKGARSARSKLGVRLEPTTVVELVTRQGRGQLPIVGSAHLVRSFSSIRDSWERQRVIAAVFGMLIRFASDAPGSDGLFHLTWRLLDALDAAPSGVGIGDALVRSWELKLLHLAGAAPQLSCCVRCGATDAITGFSSRDGGVVCRDDEHGSDRALSEVAYQATVLLTSVRFEHIAGSELPNVSALSEVRDVITRPMLVDSFGVAPDIVGADR